MTAGGGGGPLDGGGSGAVVAGITGAGPFGGIGVAAVLICQVVLQKIRIRRLMGRPMYRHTNLKRSMLL